MLKNQKTNKSNGKESVENLKLFYDFKYKTIMEAATKLTQFSLVFFSVSTFITAITTFTKFDEKTKTIVMYSMFVMVIVFMIVGIAILYGIITGLIQIRDTLKKISIDTYNDLNMDEYFKRGVYMLLIVGLVSAVGVISIVSIIFFLP